MGGKEVLNDLDRKILNILIEERRPVSSKGLALRCDASINTVRKEISLINEEMSCYGFRIESKSALGHYLNIFDRKLAEPYIQKQHNLYKRNQYMPESLEENVQYLIRKFLCSSIAFGADELSEDLYCSRSTVMRYLDKVKEILKHYQLNLVNRKGKWRVEGDEWHLRQCLLYYHKKYKLSMTENGHKEYAFKTMFFMMGGIDYYAQIRQIFIECLKQQHDFFVAFMNLPKLVNYVLLSSSRSKYVSKLFFSSQQVEKAQNTAEYCFVKKIAEKLPLYFRNTFSEQDVLALTMLILSFETQNFTCCQTREYESYVTEVGELIEYLQELWKFPRKYFDDIFEQDAICFLYALHNRQLYQVYHDTEFVGFIRHKGIRTADICICFARFYEKKHGIRLKSEETYSAFYLFHRLLKKHSVNYCVPNILIISRYGIQYARSLMETMRIGYGDEIGMIDVHEFGDVRDEDFMKYDLLITDIDPKLVRDFVSYTLPTIRVDFFLGATHFPELDEYLDQIKKSYVMKILREDSFCRTKLQSKEEVFQYVANHYGENPEEREMLLWHLRENSNYFNEERRNKVVLLPILIKGFQKPCVKILLNRTAFIWEENLSQIFVCYARDFSVQENQVINEVLQKFVHMEVEQIEELLEYSGEHLLEILYPDKEGLVQQGTER